MEPNTALPTASSTAQKKQIGEKKAVVMVKKTIEIEKKNMGWWKRRMLRRNLLW